MALFLASLAVLFLASLVGYFVVRSDAEAWPPPGMPRLPAGLWGSTALLVVSSVTMHAALRGARSGRPALLRRGLAATALLGLAFLVTQVLCWWSLVRAELTVQTNLYGFTFYVLTALHGAHVVGGLLPLAVTTRRAFGGRYGPEEHTGVTLCAMYWHFLDAVWLVIFAVLLVWA